LQNNALLLAVCSRLEGGPEKIVPFVYAPETDKSAIAKFSHIALELAGRGDPEAQGILHREAQELYQLVSAVQQRLGMPKCRIALLGGLIDHDNPYRRVVAEQLTYLGPVIPAAHNALWGAAQMAWEL
jgi:N-acetylglucosamine kinase-like BadF-type ATPase